MCRGFISLTSSWWNNDVFHVLKRIPQNGHHVHVWKFSNSIIFIRNKFHILSFFKKLFFQKFSFYCSELFEFYFLFIILIHSLKMFRFECLFLMINMSLPRYDISHWVYSEICDWLDHLNLLIYAFFSFSTVTINFCLWLFF